MPKLAAIARLAGLLTKSLLARTLAGPALAGSQFDWYGRRLAFRLLGSGDHDRFVQLLCNPVSSIRYLEFHFAWNAVHWHKINRSLDVSSPRIFPLFALSRRPDLHCEMVNPAERDRAETAAFLRALRFENRLTLSAHDARSLPYETGTFDAVFSLSVIEHIAGDGDSEAMAEMWRVLKPGGRLVITFPAARRYAEDWRMQNTYGLPTEQKRGRYFFQRLYDRPSLERRIIQPVAQRPTDVQVFGERTSGTFLAYEERWRQRGLSEAVWDPLYIKRWFRPFPRIEDLPGVGVCCLSFAKTL